MDQNACFKRLLRATKERNQHETVQAAADLLMWLLAGGAAPSSTAAQRNEVALGLARAADKFEDAEGECADIGRERIVAASRRWKTLRDAAARASWVVHEAEEDVDKALREDSGDFHGEVSLARARLRAARTLHALALWEMRKQGQADERAERLAAQPKFPGCSWCRTWAGNVILYGGPETNISQTCAHCKADGRKVYEYVRVKGRDCSICRGFHGPEVQHACE